MCTHEFKRCHHLNGCVVYIKFGSNWDLRNSKVSPLWLEIDIARNDNATYISTIDKVAKCKVFIFPSMTLKYIIRI